MHEMVAGTASALKEFKVNFPSVCCWAIICTVRFSSYYVNRNSRVSLARGKSEKECIQENKN